MEKRPFGRTGHDSTVMILGAFVFSQLNQQEADPLVEMAIGAGVNHIDVAPTYGNAEKVLGPWVKKYRDRFFLGCKTTRRDRRGAARELHSSLARLQTEYFDLYQFHAVSSIEELDQITAPGGALEAFLEAREQGLVRYLGITGHVFDAPKIFLEALARIDLASVLFPLNAGLYAVPAYRAGAQELLEVCAQRGVGVMAIKSIARSLWGGELLPGRTIGYHPFTETGEIQKAVNFVLSQDVTGICTTGEPELMPLVLKACQDFEPMPVEEQTAYIAHSSLSAV